MKTNKAADSHNATTNATMKKEGATMNYKTLENKSVSIVCAWIGAGLTVVVVVAALAAFLGLIPVWLGIPATVLPFGLALGCFLVVIIVRIVDRGVAER